MPNESRGSGRARIWLRKHWPIGSHVLVGLLVLTPLLVLLVLAVREDAVAFSTVSGWASICALYLALLIYVLQTKQSRSDRDAILARFYKPMHVQEALDYLLETLEGDERRKPYRIIYHSDASALPFFWLNRRKCEKIMTTVRALQQSTVIKVVGPNASRLREIAAEVRAHLLDHMNAHGDWSFLGASISESVVGVQHNEAIDRQIDAIVQKYNEVTGWGRENSNFSQNDTLEREISVNGLVIEFDDTGQDKEVVLFSRKLDRNRRSALPGVLQEPELTFTRDPLVIKLFENAIDIQKYYGQQRTDRR